VEIYKTCLLFEEIVYFISNQHNYFNIHTIQNWRYLINFYKILMDLELTYGAGPNSTGLLVADPNFKDSIEQ
jgi:hypothetical protein